MITDICIKVQNCASFTSLNFWTLLLCLGLLHFQRLCKMIVLSVYGDEIQFFSVFWGTMNVSVLFTWNVSR